MAALVQQAHGAVSNFDDVASTMLPNHPGPLALHQGGIGLVARLPIFWLDQVTAQRSGDLSMQS